jgi:hypothetical protein
MEGLFHNPSKVHYPVFGNLSEHLALNPCSINKKKIMLKDKSRIATVDHKLIKSWAEARNARPTQLKRFENEQITDRIRMRFPDDRFPDESDLEWEEFFDIFDTNELEFVFEDIADQAVEQGNLYQFQPRKY